MVVGLQGLKFHVFHKYLLCFSCAVAPRDQPWGFPSVTGVWALVPALPKHLEMKLVIVQGPARLAL